MQLFNLKDKFHTKGNSNKAESVDHAFVPCCDIFHFFVIIILGSSDNSGHTSSDIFYWEHVTSCSVLAGLANKI